VRATISRARRERLDALGRADECHHDEHTDREQHRLQDVRAGVVETNRIASAQPPAKAAPNTSAPIRIAALMTGDDASPDNLAGGGRPGSELMAMGPVEGRNLLEKGRAIKRKRPLKSRIA